MEKTKNDTLYAILRDRFGLMEFRSLQYQVIRSVMEGGDRVVVMGTGSGKSLCYQLPAALLEGTTLVVSPLRSLITDQLGRAAAAGLESVWLDGELRPREAARADIIFTSPERLFTGRAQRLLSRLRLSHLVIDEAHTVETWGGSFRPYLGLLGEMAKSLGADRVSLFTASADRKRMERLTRAIGLRDAAFFRGGLDRPGIRWHTVETSGPVLAAARLLTLRRGQALVYPGTRDACEETAAFFRETGLECAPYHAGLPSGTRERLQARFAAGRLRILAATSAFGMGVDVPNIRTVVHIGLPRSLDAYYQEAGRAGRDGRPALAALFYNRIPARRRQEGLAGFFRKNRSGLPEEEMEEQAFLDRLGEISGGRYPAGSLYAFLLGSGVYRRIAGERRVRVRPAGILRFDLKMALLRNASSENRAIREVKEFVSGDGCRRNRLLSAYGETAPFCPGCASCGSEYSGQVETARVFSERVAALARRIRSLSPAQALDIVRNSGLAPEERAVAEYAVFRAG